MKFRPISLLIAIVLVLALPAGAVVYYVDYGGGDDSNDGLSESTAWKHCPGDGNALEKALETNLVGGDVVYFRAGSVYVTGGISLRFSGSEGKPITYDGVSWGGTTRCVITTNNEPRTAMSAGGKPTSFVKIKNLHFKDIGGFSDDNPIWKGLAFSADPASDQIMSAEPHGLVPGDKVGFRNEADPLPAGLSGGTAIYFVSEVHSERAFSVTTSSGGAVRDITASGGGLVFKLVTAPPGGTGINLAEDGTNIEISDCKFEEIGQWQTIAPMSGTVSMTGTGIRLESNGWVDVLRCDFTKMRVGISVQASGARYRVNDITIQDCDIHHNIVWGIDVSPRASNCTIENITIADTSIRDYSQCDSGNWQGFGDKPHRDGIFFRNSAYSGIIWQNVVVERCRFSESDRGDSKGGTSSVYISEGPSVTVRNNLFLRDPQANGFIAIGGNSKSAGDQVVTIQNNTFVGGRAIYLSSGNASEVKVTNNIFFLESTSVNGSLFLDNTTGGKRLYSNNLYFSRAEDVSAWRGFMKEGAYKTFAQWQQLGHDSGSVLANPEFASVEGPISDWDLRVQSGSPAVTLGTNLSDQYTSDFMGNLRPAEDTSWVIGAVSEVAPRSAGSRPAPPAKLRIK